MKTIKTILIAVLLVFGFSITASAQALEGEWEGTNSAGQFLKLVVGNNSVYFEFNGTAANTIDIELYPNFTPERVQIGYYPTASNSIVRYFTGIYEFVNSNTMNFQYIESDGSVYPTSFAGGFVMHKVTGGLHDPHPDINYTD